MARLNTEVRSHESPMDWQWQEGHGPTDTDSPFLKGAADSSQSRVGFAGQKRRYTTSQREKKRKHTDVVSYRLRELSRFPSEDFCSVCWPLRVSNLSSSINTLSEASLLSS